MADCGSSGSTLDRAARALVGHPHHREGGGKHVASWLEHMAMNSAAASGTAVAPMPMPIAAPDYLILPSVAANTSSRSTVNPNTLAASQPATASSSFQHHHHRLVMHHPSHHHHPFTAAAPPSLMPMHPLQQQQHHPMMMMHQQQQAHMARLAQQQQHMMMMQQQQQFLLLQQQQQQFAIATSAKQQQQPDQQQQDDDVVTVGEYEQDEAYNNEGHEGYARPVGIEELAAAWAEAQEEYEQLEAAVNLAAAANTAADALHASTNYEFLHKVEPEDLSAYSSSATIQSPQQEQHQAKDWMEEGGRHFAEGNIKAAIRAFEMELQLHNPDNAVAWRMLGRCHAENDQDPLAIACLEQAVDRDPYCPQVRLALGVSYVNELHHAAALENLKAWITHNPKFAGILQESQEDLYGAGSGGLSGEDGGGIESAFEEVQQLLLQALGIEADADVLEALGVVYNVSHDYEAAVDAFTRAIAVRPDNYQLYNRLGATLANCNQCEKALPMYKQALDLRPKYARAWLNSAISYSNLKNYDQAARCYLQTLSLNPAATHCWSYLRIALSCAEEWDLIPFAAAMDLNAFRDRYDFILYHDQ